MSGIPLPSTVIKIAQKMASDVEIREKFSFLALISGKQGKLAAIFNTSSAGFCDPQHGGSTHERQYTNLHVSFELLRCLFLSMFRSLKMTGWLFPRLDLHGFCFGLIFLFWISIFLGCT